MNLKPAIALIARIFIWIIAFFISIAVTVVIAVLVAASTTIIMKWEFLGMYLGLWIASIVWPGFLTSSLIMIDRSMFIGPSKRLLKRALIWGIPPALFVGFLTVLCIGPFGWWEQPFIGDDSDPKITLLLYMAPAVLAAIIENRCTKAERMYGA